jgi:hypothetical protein
MIWIKRRSEGLAVSSIAALGYDNAISPYLSVDYSRHFSLVNPASGSAFQVQLDEARAVGLFGLQRRQVYKPLSKEN